VEVTVVAGLVLYEAGYAAIPGVVLIFLTQPLQVRHTPLFIYLFIKICFHVDFYCERFLVSNCQNALMILILKTIRTLKNVPINFLVRGANNYKTFICTRASNLGTV